MPSHSDGGVQINDLALAAGGKETGRGVIEVIDGVLQFAEETLLILALRRDVGDLENVQPLAARILQHPAFQPVPMRPRAGIIAERFQQPELLVTVAAFAQHVDETIKRFGRFAAARQKRLGLWMSLAFVVPLMRQ